MTQFFPFWQSLFLLIACYIFSFLIMHSLARVSGRYFFLRLFLFPGVMIHELAHVVACIVTATPIQSVSFWTETGGEVIHHKPKLAVFTQPLISFAPFPVGLGLLLLLSHYLQQVDWRLAIFLLYLMVSIAATLAPSKTDALHAIEGSIVVIGIILALAIFVPNFVLHFAPTVTQFNQQMVLITVILVGMWLIIFLLHHTLQLLRR